MGLTIGATGLIVIAGIFACFGAFTAGWNTGYKFKEREGKHLRSTTETVGEVDIKAEVIIPESHITDFGFAYANSEARHKMLLEMAEDIIPNIDMTMSHIANQERYSYTGHLRLVKDRE